VNAPQATANEAGKALDALVALSVQLSCHCDVEPDTLVLPARKVHKACSIINEAVLALKKIVVIAEADGGGPGLSRP